MGKMQDRNEVIQWLKDGHTYGWMVEQYKDLYDLEVSPSMFANVRREEGMPRRIARNSDLVPWAVKIEHRWDYAISMLRIEARRREGFILTEKDEHMVDAWLREREAEDSVVHYEPETEQGWFYVPRRPGIDKDIIREPEIRTTRKVRQSRTDRRSTNDS